MGQITIPPQYANMIEDLTGLTFDGDNPNIMTPTQKETIWKSLEEFGWIYPIVVDENGLLGDGQQRVEVALEHGETHGPVLRIRELDDTKRRILRQVLNKLKGQHDEVLDAQEFIRIIDGGGEDRLRDMFKWDEGFGDILDGLNENQDEEPAYATPSDEGMERKIVLIFPVNDFNIVVEWFAKLMESHGLNSREDAIKYMIKQGWE